MDVKYNTDTKIEDNSRAFKLQKANFDKEVNTAVSDHIRNSILWKYSTTTNVKFIQYYVFYSRQLYLAFRNSRRLILIKKFKNTLRFSESATFSNGENIHTL